MGVRSWKLGVGSWDAGFIKPQMDADEDVFPRQSMKPRNTRKERATITFALHGFLHPAGEH
jgi:hypothetical protein